jgi:peroxiredoxin
MRLLYLILLTTILVFNRVNAHASQVRLYGSAPDYASLAIEIETVSDYLTNTSRTLSVMMIDDTGTFDISFELEHPSRIMLNLGAYSAYLYAYPNAEYEIVLPPFKPRADADRLNPFFRPETIELGIINTSSVPNDFVAIQTLDNVFAKYDPYMVYLTRSRNTKRADELILDMDSTLMPIVNSTSDSIFPLIYKYTRAQLWTAPRIRMPRTVLKELYANDPVLWDIPAYWQSQRMVNKDFILTYCYSRHGKEMKSALSQNPLTFGSLDSILRKDSLFKQTELREMLLIQGIYDGFYSKLFSDGQTDTLLITATNQAQSERVRDLALTIYNKKNHLKVGSNAPEFTLFDIEGNEVSLADLRGKFVYLGFLHTENYACIKDMAALNGVQRKYKRDMTVVGIMTDEKSDGLPDFFEDKKSNWLILSATLMPRVISDYGVTNLPTYFLIDPEGRLVTKATPSPTENIETEIANRILSYKREQQKKAPKRERNIYDLVKYSR